MRRLIYYLLTILGFGTVAMSCYGNFSGGDQVVMYGVPAISYRISARVVDKEGNAIKDIEAKALYDLERTDYYYAVGYSDKDGNIYAEQVSGSTPPYLQLRDVDGKANGGEFKTMTIELNGRFTEPEDGVGFYEADLGDIELTESDDNETLKP